MILIVYHSVLCYVMLYLITPGTSRVRSRGSETPEAQRGVQKSTDVE